MLENPIMVTTQRLAIVLLVLCLTCATQTAPLNISFLDFQNQFTKKISKSLQEVKWGCAEEFKCYENIDWVKKIVEKEVKWGTCTPGTKCYEQNTLLIELLRNRGMTAPPRMKSKNEKVKKAKKKQVDDMLKEKV